MAAFVSSALFSVNRSPSSLGVRTSRSSFTNPFRYGRPHCTRPRLSRQIFRRRLPTTSKSAMSPPSSQNGAPIDGSSITSSSSSTSALREILEGVLQLAIPLWNGKRRRVAWLWTLATIFLALLATLYAVMLSMIQKFFWNCLSAKDTAKFGKLLLLYCIAVTIGPVVLSMFEWVKQRLALMWRRTLTEHLMKQYFSDLNYYKLSLDEASIDNPDQRISEDVMKFTSRAVRFITILGVGVFDLIIFSVILYRVYSPLLYALIAYATAGTLFISYAGRRLLRLNRMQVTREADFRFGLVRIREATEGVAFYSGEVAEKQELFGRFASLFRNSISLLGLKRNVNYLSSSFRYWVQVIPTAVIAPQYFAGNVPLGTLSQVYFSFNHVLSSLGLIVAEFSALAEFGAGVRRLKGLADELSSESKIPPGKKIRTEICTDQNLPIMKISSLSVQTPSDPPRQLVQDLNLDISLREKLLIVGRSGIGKSSLLRALCGMWEVGGGQISKPSRENTLFLPQKPFIMLGTLRENVLYPRQREDATLEEVETALRRVNLGYLIGSKEELDLPGETLTRRLSLGEQQRLAFARILISRPNLVILDESTSALDLENERDMYGIITDLGITCISVGNRPSLLSFHDKVLRLEADGKWKVEKPETVWEQQKGDLSHT